MIFEPTGLEGAWLLRPQAFADARGYFVSLWDDDSLRAQGLTEPMRSNLAYNREAGTLRGLHYQLPPVAEAKLVRCTRGRIFDVGVDLRPDSPGFLQWIGYELGAESLLQLYLPAGFAHGYLTLDPDSEVQYQTSGPYRPEAAQGLRWNDPWLKIDWPAEVKVIAPRDATYPDLDPVSLPRDW